MRLMLFSFFSTNEPISLNRGYNCSASFFILMPKLSNSSAYLLYNSSIFSTGVDVVLKIESSERILDKKISLAFSFSPIFNKKSIFVLKSSFLSNCLLILLTSLHIPQTLKNKIRHKTAQTIEITYKNGSIIKNELVNNVTKIQQFL